MILKIEKLNWYYTLYLELIDTLVISKMTQDQFEQVEEYINFKEIIIRKSQLCLLDSKFNRVPRIVNDRFSHLTHLRMESCKLTTISKNDFRNLRNLNFLLLDDNNLSKLPGDLFTNTIELRVVSFSNNRLTWVGSNLLDCVTQLEVANFLGNPIINDLSSDVGSEDGTRFGFPYVPTTLFKLRQTIKKGFGQEPFSEVVEEGRIPIPARTLELASLKDFTIIINGENIEVHRIVLASFSPVFSKIFEENPSARILQLVDCLAAIFRVILDFMYKGELPNDNVNMTELFAAAVAELCTT